MAGVVIATGGETFFGRTAKLVAGAGAVSHAQKAMFQIGNFLIFVVPLGCVAYYPVLAILDQPDPLGAPAWWLPTAPAVMSTQAAKMRSDGSATLAATKTSVESSGAA